MTATPQRFEENRLLCTLPSIVLSPLQADLERVELRAGTVLYAGGMAVRHVHFPATTTVSLVSSMTDGDAAEVAVVGAEGMVGVCAFMGSASASSDAIVQRTGVGYRMSATALLQHTRRSPCLMQHLLGYTHTLFTHMAQTSACNRHHAIEQQFCRWLLQHLDRQEGIDLQITHERIASLMGVRREGVTGAAIKLQKAGLIDYSRGQISVIDREGLEARSCECYGVVRQAYKRLSHALGDASLTPGVDAFGMPCLVSSRPELTAT